MGTWVAEAAAVSVAETEQTEAAPPVLEDRVDLEVAAVLSERTKSGPCAWDMHRAKRCGAKIRSGRPC